MRARDGARAPKHTRDCADARRDARASSRRARLVPALAFLCVIAAPQTAVAQYPAAEAYDAKYVSPTGADRTYGAAVAADDGRVAALSGLGSVSVTRFASADATSAVATLELDDDDVSATDLEDVVGASPRHLAMRDGLVVLGAPGRGGGTGGARVWRLDTSAGANANAWTGPVDLASSDGARNHMGVSAATAGGAAVALGAPSDDEGKGAVYVFLDSDGDATFELPPLKVTAPSPRAGDRFGASVAITHGVRGPGNGWLAAAAPGADDGAGAVFCFARVDLTGGSFGYAHVQILTSAPKTYGSYILHAGFGATVALTGRFLLATRAPPETDAGFGESVGDASVFLLARTSAALFSVNASSEDRSAVVATEEGRWVLDAVLVPGSTPSDEPDECSFGAGALDGESVVLGVVGRASADGLGGSVSAFRRVTDQTNDALKKWAHQSRRTSADVLGVSPVLGFGRAVAIDGAAAVVAAAGAFNAMEAAEDFHEGSGVLTRFRKENDPPASPPPPPSPPRCPSRCVSASRWPSATI